MHTKTRIGCIVSILTLIPAMILLAQPVASTTLSTYRNTQYSFTLRYPSHLTPSHSGSIGSDLASEIGIDGVGMSGDEVVGFVVTHFDGSKYPSFSGFAADTWVDVVVSPDVSGCYAGVSTPRGPVPPTDVTINGMQFKRLDAIGNAMGGRSIEVIGNRIIHDGRCFAIEQGSLFAPGGGGPGATSAETDAFNTALNSAQQTTAATAIVNSFQFTDTPGGRTAPGAPSLHASDAIHLPFAIGSTRILVKATPDGTQSKDYTVTAAAGQPLLIDAAGDAGNEPVLGITAVPEGTVLLSDQERSSNWQSMLTRTGDYLIRVGSTGALAPFQLTIEAPAPVHFPSGTGSATRSGPTPGGLPVDYVIHATSGQTLTASVTSSGGAVGLALTPLIDTNSYPHTQSISTDHYQFVVPADGNYIISVVPPSGEVIHYSLHLALSN